jgi:hypothetical protein
VLGISARANTCDYSWSSIQLLTKTNIKVPHNQLITSSRNKLEVVSMKTKIIEVRNKALCP